MVDKRPGDSCHSDVQFQHKGSPRIVDVNIWLFFPGESTAFQPSKKVVNCGNDSDWQTYSVSFDWTIQGLYTDVPDGTPGQLTVLLKDGEISLLKKKFDNVCTFRNGTNGGGTVRSQLGDCWDYISGAGTTVDGAPILVLRDGEWLWYDITWDGLDQVKAFQTGDYVMLYLVGSHYLTLQSKWLVDGWNEFSWV